MEPQATPETAPPVARPVMDVRPPRPVAPLGPAPAAAVPAPAPIITSASEAPVPAPAASPTLQPVSVKQAPAEESSSDGAEAAPSSQKSETGFPAAKTVATSKPTDRNPHTPLGLISATVIVMVGLAAAAVAVYVNSQPGL